MIAQRLAVSPEKLAAIVTVERAGDQHEADDHKTGSQLPAQHRHRAADDQRTPDQAGEGDGQRAIRSPAAVNASALANAPSGFSTDATNSVVGASAANSPSSDRTRAIPEQRNGQQDKHQTRQR